MFIKCLKVGSIETNCYIACDKVSNRAAVIDPGAEAARITAALEETGCTADYVILTHGHADHMSAAKEVVRNTGAKLAVFADELPLLNDPQKSMSAVINPTQDFETFNPDIMLRDGDTLTLGSIQLKALYTPGHTSGSCCIIAQDTLFSGDTLFRRSAGRTDLPTGNTSQLMESLKRLFSLDGDLKVLPGHGEFSTLEFERLNNPFSGSQTNAALS
jgi:glyoxylase-like metal-dependent hydrolase (beta-lactamase superfamily II)